jgi:hypothetical protein
VTAQQFIPDRRSSNTRVLHPAHRSLAPLRDLREDFSTMVGVVSN